MLKIYREEPDRYSSELVEKPLDHLSDLAVQCASGDPQVGRELDVAMELLGEVFSVRRDEILRMIKERMARRGMIRDHSKPLPGDASQETETKPKRARSTDKRSSKPLKKMQRANSIHEENAQ
jgi:hypothetical protein